MKKLHKKIGAIAVASMVVAGGVAASGVESHAWWGRRAPVVIDHNSWDLKKLSKGARIDVDYLEDYIKHNKGKRNIEIVAASDNLYDLNEYIKRKFDEKPDLVKRLLLEGGSSRFYGREVMDILNIKQREGHNIVKVKFGQAYLLISQY